jgi:hypothetical protein
MDERLTTRCPRTAILGMVLAFALVVPAVGEWRMQDALGAPATKC